jgi:hypothetical protein
VRLEGETFVDVRLESRTTEATFVWRGGTWSLRVPSEIGLLWARVRNLAGGRLWVIVERRRSWWRRVGGPPRHELWVLDRRALPAAAA